MVQGFHLHCKAHCCQFVYTKSSVALDVRICQKSLDDDHKDKNDFPYFDESRY